MIGSDVKSVASFLNSRINEYEYKPKVCEYGVVRSCTDDIVQIDGLSTISYGELISFDGDAYGLALEMSENGVGAVLLGKSSIGTSRSNARSAWAASCWAGSLTPSADRWTVCPSKSTNIAP